MGFTTVNQDTAWHSRCAAQYQLRPCAIFSGRQAPRALGRRPLYDLDQAVEVVIYLAVGCVCYPSFHTSVYRMVSHVFMLCSRGCY